MKNIKRGWMLFGALACSIIGCGPPPAVSIPQAQKLEKKNIGRHKLSVDLPDVGKVLYTIEIPETYDGKKPVPLVLFLHYGYEGAKPAPHTGAGMIDLFASGVNNHGAIALAPDVQNGDWRSANNEKAAIWLVKSALETYNIDKDQIVVSGYSMGGEGALFVGSRHQDLFAGALPMAAPVAGSKEWKIPVYFVHSDADQVVSYAAAKSHAERIKSAGGEVHFESLKGLKHFDTHRYIGGFNNGLKWLAEKW